MLIKKVECKMLLFKVRVLPREIVTRRNTVGALLTLNMELNKKSPPGNGDSKGGFRATQRC